MSKWIFTSLLALVICTAASISSAQNGRVVTSTLIEPLNGSQVRILIVSPHPDDDILGAAALMKSVLNLRSQRVEAEVRVVYMTCGDSYGVALQQERKRGMSKTFRELGAKRHGEAVAALRSIGVDESRSVFLGYPDQGLMPLFAASQQNARAYKSPATLESQVFYPFALHPGAPFTRVSVISDLKQIITTFKPTAVFSPTLTDNHSDHRATREFVTTALHELKSKTPHYEFLIHWEQIEDGWPQATTSWRPPANHVPPDFSITLEKAGLSLVDKRKALAFHDSQMAVDATYLNEFVKTAEPFWRSRESMADYLN